MAEPVMRALEIVVPPIVAANGTTITYHGLDNIPDRGGALIAVNHTGYVDWLPASLAALQRRRRLRFMIKAEMQEVAPVNFVIKHIGLIPVDRRAGADSYAVAVQRLKEGELVGVHPEATISRSFELKEFKTGAARMARAADVPIIPCIVWGAHRIWTKDHPKSLWRNKIPILAKFGEPMRADDTVEATTAALHETMATMLHQTQEEYPHPAGAFWVPRRLGGGAPTMAEALTMREAELAERARRRAEGRAPEPARGRWRRRTASR
ncbi:lysophospholipid acyltransferase family protein [Mycobacterium sp. pUA109]|uniref:lysophospholipid acyltransferase family protein n=1 Tax=Mycobacterium sp. pUA109 TaxID=3238982 RepID=UPI00351ADB2E